jgi:hypothetical protein
MVTDRIHTDNRSSIHGSATNSSPYPLKRNRRSSKIIHTCIQSARSVQCLTPNSEINAKQKLTISGDSTVYSKIIETKMKNERFL